MVPAKKNKKAAAPEEKKAETAVNPVPATAPSPVTAPAPAPSNGKAVLIVEDEKPLSHALEMKLAKSGYTTKVVTNGDEALKEMKANKYHLILLDLIMPVMDGFDLLNAMKDAKISVPSIVLSNLGQDEDREKAKALGAIDYFVKANTPIAEIISRVEKAI